MRKEITENFHIDPNEIIWFIRSGFGIEIGIRGMRNSLVFEDGETINALLRELKLEYINKDGKVISE